ncbi:glucose-6-phosphate dehydrogenase [Pasteurellaceae bacterium HPA106]|uniref:glucose-6-phosphate dehydrogenase n=1 Tax=Spirabiliibacterium pneumoniae TaxID=221400 RepID=UPI001AAC5788|nr:glucose-6-phosphate dehydrogenase [Spirabiliibacterium pneumoniae]MBE2897073.1 glucose-6-phosphate dehydrogenase [Spirabiliibacterium pneumoniae]
MKKPENSTIVIFGASGDLTHRKLIPALYDLYKSGRLSDDFAILGVSRTEYSDQAFRDKLKALLIERKQCSEQEADAYFAHVYYEPIDTAKVEEYEKVKVRLAELEKAHNTGGNTLFYLSTPPSLYPVIPQCLAKHGLNSQDHGWKRLVVEKPFGYDLKSAIELDESLHKNFDESQIYRIDHYLGKETVQNILVLRFSNGLFEPLWNRNYIDYVEITGAESIGVEERGGYYDGAGAMRDMFQNHLLQVLALIAMESPAIIDAESMRNEVQKVLQSLHPISEDDLEKNLVLGQYTGAKVRGEYQKGYREEKGVAEDSRTETYMALKLKIDNWRWSGVPFYVRTGKRLPTRVTEIVIHFKSTPHPVFRQSAPENKLIIRIQPNEGIVMKFGLKEPGAGFHAKQVSMDFHYEDLADADIIGPYERLLLDSLQGDATLFSRSDAVRSCWKFVQPILDYKAGNPKLYGYACGTWGPKEADEMMEIKGRSWRFPCKNLTDTEYCEL